MGVSLARQEAVGRVFRQFGIQTEPFIRSKPRRLAGYPDPLLTLDVVLVGFLEISYDSSTKKISVRADWLRQSCQRHPGGGLLLAQSRYYASRCISPSDRCFAVSSCPVSHLLYTSTLALWLTVTIHRNGFIGYTLASGLPLRKSLLTFFLH
jgi:hypothetical protein